MTTIRNRLPIRPQPTRETLQTSPRKRILINKDADKGYIVNKIKIEMLGVELVLKTKSKIHTETLNSEKQAMSTFRFFGRNPQVQKRVFENGTIHWDTGFSGGVYVHKRYIGDFLDRVLDKNKLSWIPSCPEDIVGVSGEVPCEVYNIKVVEMDDTPMNHPTTMYVHENDESNTILIGTFFLIHLTLFVNKPFANTTTIEITQADGSKQTIKAEDTGITIHPVSYDFKAYRSLYATTESGEQLKNIVQQELLLISDFVRMKQKNERVPERHERVLLYYAEHLSIHILYCQFPSFEVYMNKAMLIVRAIYHLKRIEKTRDLLGILLPEDHLTQSQKELALTALSKDGLAANLLLPESNAKKREGKKENKKKKGGPSGVTRNNKKMKFN
ncbi:asparagine tRS [Acrasis kona]|uniref:Asparagine tRS n=1 Tax=Acrasis kona TaxID=1008807 RepID=A0AAW2YZA6_9EUKA